MEDSNNIYSSGYQDDISSNSLGYKTSENDSALTSLGNKWKGTVANYMQSDEYLDKEYPKNDPLQRRFHPANRRFNSTIGDREFYLSSRTKQGKPKMSDIFNGFNSNRNKYKLYGSLSSSFSYANPRIEDNLSFTDDTF